MIYRTAKQVSGVLVGALMMLAVIWSMPEANAFPAAVLPATPPAIVLQEALVARL